jgi:hypothetical protein
VVTAEDKEDKAKSQKELLQAEATIAEQKRKVGELETNIRKLRESM